MHKRKGGSSLLSHYMSLEKKGRSTPLSQIVIPPECHYVFLWFLELTKRRQSHFSKQPLLPETILAWSAGKKIDLAAFEFGWLCALDDRFIQEAALEAERQKGEQPQGAKG